MFNFLENCFKCSETRLLYSNFRKSPYRGRGITPSPPPPPPFARSLRSLAEDLRQMCPFRFFAPPKLKVFRHAWLVESERRLQIKCMRVLLRISYNATQIIIMCNVHVVLTLVGTLEPLLSTIHGRKLAWFGHGTRHNILCRIIL